MSILYLSPIRALLNNQQERLERYFRLIGREAGCWHGDAPRSVKRRFAAHPPDCLLTTPESLEAMLVSAHIDHRRLFRSVQAIVVDELHAFAGDDRGWHLLSVLARIERIAGRCLQRIGLSATVGNPAEMLDWLSSGSAHQRQVIHPSPENRARPEVQIDYVGSLANAATVIAKLHRGEKRLVFCDSRSRVEQLALSLRERRIETFVSHSSLGVEERRLAEQAFAQRQDCVIAATSSLELGLDVGDLDRVLQIDAPAAVSSFLQRMGRTGRRPGTLSNCLFLATSDEALLRSAAIVRLWRVGYVESVHAPPEPYHILAQQLMALSLQEKGIGRTEWLDHLRSIPEFAQLDQTIVADLTDSLIEARILWSDGDLLSFAPEGEAAYGRRNFMDLLSVFTAPPLFRVLWGRKELGSVHASTFLNHDGKPTVLTLAGRCWRATHLDRRRQIAYVEPTDQNGRSRWLGDGPPLSYEVCQAMRAILAGDDEDSSWSRRAAVRIGELRQEFSWIRPDSTTLVRPPNGPVSWWSFAGGVANAILAQQFTPFGTTRIAIETDSSLGELREHIISLAGLDLTLAPDSKRVAGLKFAESLPQALAQRIARIRFSAKTAIRSVLEENAITVS